MKRLKRMHLAFAGGLPVISYAPSLQNYSDDVTSYSVQYNWLKNQCALVKFRMENIFGNVVMDETVSDGTGNSDNEQIGGFSSYFPLPYSGPITYYGWIDLFGWGTGNSPRQCRQENNYYSTYTEWGSNPIMNDGTTYTSGSCFYVRFGNNIPGTIADHVDPDYYMAPDNGNAVRLVHRLNSRRFER